MPRLFVTPRALVRAHLLDDYMQRPLAFNAEDAAHVTLINECSRDVQNKLKRLQSVDKKIVGGLALGVSALALSFIAPLGLVAIAGLSYAAYEYGNRQRVYEEYHQALDNLVKCCVWSLGHVENQALHDLPAITQMINTLAPLTNEKQLRDYIDDDVEDVFVQDAAVARVDQVAFDRRLTQEQEGVFYGMYGYQQGSVSQIVSGLRYAIMEGFRTLKSKVQSLIENHHLPVEEQAAAEVAP